MGSGGPGPRPASIGPRTRRALRARDGAQGRAAVRAADGPRHRDPVRRPGGLADVDRGVVVGELWIRMLRMLVVPLIVASIIQGVGSLGDIRHLGKLGGATVTYYVVTSGMAIVLGNDPRQSD